MKISSEKKILYSTPVGGRSSDWGIALAIDEYGTAVVGGQSYSDEFPLRRELSDGSYDVGHRGDGFVFMLLDISDEDGDNFPNWWEMQNGYDPLNPDAPLIEVLVWYAPVILVFGVATFLMFIILWFGRHRIRSWTGRVSAYLDTPVEA